MYTPQLQNYSLDALFLLHGFLEQCSEQLEVEGSEKMLEVRLIYIQHDQSVFPVLGKAGLWSEGRLN